MSIIRPPISGDSPQDSWMNQVTEAINKGLLGPSINPAASAVVSVDAVSAATLFLYTRTTGATPTAMDVDVTFNYATNVFTPAAPFGTSNWERSPPGVINGDYLWVTTTNISSNTGSETIASSSWSTPSILSVNGQSFFVCEAYIRKASQPSTPTGGSYNFTTTTLTPPTGNPPSDTWYNFLPSGSDPVYISTATASIAGSQGVDSTLTWSSPIKMVEDGATGSDGIDGAELESGLIYYTIPQASSPATPSATDFNFTTGTFVGLTSNWQTTPVTVNVTSTTSLFWSSRYRITKVAGAATATVIFSPPIASVNFGTNIQSDNYIAGNSGWQIARSSGSAEFNNVNVRGGVIADSMVAAAISANSISAEQLQISKDGSAIYTTLPTSSTTGTPASNATGMYFNSIHNRIEVWDSGTLRVAVGGLNFLP